MNPEQWLSLKWNGGSTMSDRWLNQSKIIQNDTMIENSFDCLYKYDHRGDIKFNVQTWDSWYAEYSENIIK